jgi:branched-chain amino acid aminotransferase
MKEIIFIDGEYVNRQEAMLNVAEPAVLYGFGIFETMRCAKGRIVYFKQHMRRLKRSCGFVGIAFRQSLGQIAAVTKETVRRNGHEDAAVRLSLYKGLLHDHLVIGVSKYQPPSIKQYSRGFRCAISSFTQNSLSALSAIKSTNRLLYQLAYQEARKKGFDEAVILNQRGFITEGSRTNIFLVKKHALLTPAVSCGCLGGITRQAVLDIAKRDGMRAFEKTLTLKECYAADEAFLTNSLMGIMPLRAIGRTLIRKPQGAKMTAFFIQAYKSLIENTKEL